MEIYYKAPQDNFIVDELNDFSKVYQKSGNWTIDTSNPTYFMGDSSRAIRTSTGNEYLIYNVPVNNIITYFSADKFFWPGEAVVPNKIYTSPDGSTYTEIIPLKNYIGRRAPDGWILYVYELPDLPASTRYIKIEGRNTTNSWNPNIGRVLIRYTELVTTVNDNTTGTGNNQFNYVGSWSYGPQTGAYNNDNHWSNTTNNYFEVKFNGTQISWYACKAPNVGIAAVSIDGGVETNVDQYASTRSDNVLLYTSPTLTSGQHTLKVRVTGTKNASSSDTYVTADRVDITN